MSTENNKAVVRRSFEGIWNDRNMSVINEVYASNHILHDPNSPDLGPGPEGMRKHLDFYMAAFPDARLNIDDMVAEGDRVVTRWTTRATHRGELQGLAPTNKQITVTGIMICRCENDKIVESHQEWDALGMMQQLGALSQLGAAKAARR